MTEERSYKKSIIIIVLLAIIFFMCFYILNNKNIFFGSSELENVSNNKTVEDANKKPSKKPTNETEDKKEDNDDKEKDKETEEPKKDNDNGSITGNITWIASSNNSSDKKPINNGGNPNTNNNQNNNIITPKPTPTPDEKPEPLPSPTPEKITVTDTSFKGFDLKQITPIDKKVTYTEFQISTKKQVEKGVYGNNSQWPCQLETSADGSVMLFGEDVSGLFKSNDHGKTWKRSNSGIDSPGVGMFAIDPHNTSHILALGLSTREYIGDIYISMDEANSWNKACFYESEEVKCNGTSSNGARYQYDGLEFDGTTYDTTLGITTDVYYSTPFLRDDDLRTNPNETFTESEEAYYKFMKIKTDEDATKKKNKMGLYYSHDGGNTFEMFIKDVKLADGIVIVLNNGSLYVGNEYGLFKIDKENKTISKTYLENETEYTSHGITGLDYVGNTVYAGTWDGIYKIDDINETITKISNDETYKNVWPQALTVSKTNENHMIMTYRTQVTNYYTTHVVFSMDGGSTWTESEVDLDSTFYNVSWYAREKMFIIDPSDDSKVITFGSDYVMNSSDYGANFIQSSGTTHMMQGGKFNFNYYNPDVLFLSAQDYTGVITHDKAATFKNILIKGNENQNIGNVYGGFAADDMTFYGFAKETWCGGNLTVTHDGGDTWIDTGLASNDDEVPKCSFYSSLQSITNPDVLFANEYYSKDHGYTWNKMNGCTSVFTYNYTGKHELYGTDSMGNIVVSYDNGDTWQRVSNTIWDASSAKYGEHIIDLAYDHINNVFYVVAMSYNSYDKSTRADRTNIYKYDANTHTKTLLSVPKDGKVGSMRFKTVAVDPNSTSVVYVGGSGDYFQTATALMRSVDGGSSWRVLTTANKSYIESWAENQGGYEISNIRVDPYTGYALMSAGCNGYFLIDPPYDSSVLKHETPKDHTIKYVYNGKVVDTKTWKNNTKHNYKWSKTGLKFEGWYLDENLTIPFNDNTLIFNSFVLYAKMSTSHKIAFYENNEAINIIDSDKYNENDSSLILQREGYVFAGWYKDKALTGKVDFNNITTDIKAYAGFYKVVDNIYNPNMSDYNTAINYIDQKVESLAASYDNTKRLNNRATMLNLKANTSYFIRLKMDNRFRLGFYETNWPSGYNAVPNYYIHPYDVNSKFDHVNKYVSYLLNNVSYKKMLLYYYTSNDEVNFMDVKNTIEVYELVDTTLYL